MEQLYSYHRMQLFPFSPYHRQHKARKGSLYDLLLQGCIAKIDMALLHHNNKRFSLCFVFLSQNTLSTCLCCSSTSPPPHAAIMHYNCACSGGSSSGLVHVQKEGEGVTFPPSTVLYLYILMPLHAMVQTPPSPCLRRYDPSPSLRACLGYAKKSQPRNYS